MKRIMLALVPLFMGPFLGIAFARLIHLFACLVLNSPPDNLSGIFMVFIGAVGGFWSGSLAASVIMDDGESDDGQ